MGVKQARGRVGIDRTSRSATQLVGIGAMIATVLGGAAAAQPAVGPASEGSLRQIATSAVTILQEEQNALAQQSRRVAELRESVARLKMPQPPAAPPPQPVVAELERSRAAAGEARASADRVRLEARLQAEATQALTQHSPDAGLFARRRFSPVRALRYAAADLHLQRSPLPSASGVVALQRGTPVLVLLAEVNTPWRVVYGGGHLGFVREEQMRDTAP